MINFSEADWHTPRGTGTVTVVGLFVGAAVASVQRARPRRPAPEVGPDRPRAVATGRTSAG